jgi:CheY-like chemotaxis protein
VTGPPLPNSQEKVNILIVEDNPAVRKLIRRAISYLATEVNECEDGADALSAYATHQPDIVFMDIRMGRMDGLCATREILKSYPQAFIVIVTDYDQEDLRHAAFAAGAKGYALKDNLLSLEAFIIQRDLEDKDSPNGKTE